MINVMVSMGRVFELADLRKGDRQPAAECRPKGQDNLGNTHLSCSVCQLFREDDMAGNWRENSSECLADAQALDSCLNSNTYRT